MSKVTRIVDFASGQWILDGFGTNGGEVVILRTSFITLWFSCLALALQAAVDPARHGPISLHGLQSQLMDLAAWLAAFFGAAYLALYTRFVSQWGYLANVYNLIKQAESANGADKNVIAEWKAGFLEDADHLHLVGKRSLAPIISSWGKDSLVVAAFDTATPGGRVRRERIVASADTICEAVAKKEGSA